MSPEENFRQQVGQVLALFAEGRHLEMLQALQPMIEAYPNQPTLYNLAGAAQMARGRVEPAMKFYDRALQLKPDFAEAHVNRGVLLRMLGRAEEALASYDEAIRCRPEFPEAWLHRGNALHQLRRLDEALESFAAVIARQPDHADAWSNRGNVLHEMGFLDEALENFDRATDLRPGLIAAHRNRAITLHQLQRFDEAVEAYRAAIRLDPAHAETISHLVFLKANMCDWEPEPGVDIEALGVSAGAVPPFNLLALDDDAERSFIRSRNWAEAKYPGQRPVLQAAGGIRPHRLRIGYFSADFHDHATMWLMGSLFAEHDRDRFEIHAFSYGPDRHDEKRERAAGTADAFHDVRDRGDADIAGFARGLGIDIAVDLKGYTQDTRPGIFACGAAPIQVGWLGYPGSSGGEFLDYIVADPVVVPPEHRQYYSEKLIELPYSYQVNDDQRPLTTAPARGALGLPENGFVFCCFNQNFKITPQLFDIWMRLLASVDGSVLWLLSDNRWAEENLRTEAERSGIDPDRLVFADRVSVSEHLARHAQADLFLDSFAYNAHTTASDALWVGVPIVTRLGDGFAARVAASLLRTLGLPELVTSTAEDYERLALSLAGDPERLAAIKGRIRQARTSSPLFDTPRFARHLERGFELAYERWAAGLAPDHIEVPAT